MSGLTVKLSVFILHEWETTKKNLRSQPLASPTPGVRAQPAFGSLLSEPNLSLKFQLTWQRSYGQTCVFFAHLLQPTCRPPSWGIEPTITMFEGLPGDGLQLYLEPGRWTGAGSIGWWCPVSVWGFQFQSWERLFEPSTQTGLKWSYTWLNLPVVIELEHKA